jgi:hypothetical protein
MTALHVIAVPVGQVVAAAGQSFAQLVNDHMIQPGAGVAQLVVLMLAIFEAMGSAASHHQEHWMQAIIRPVGLGLAGLIVIEVLKLAANAVLAGTVGF